MSAFARNMPKEMTMAKSSDEHHDYITDSVAGILALLVVVGGLVLVATFFYVFK